MTYPDSSATLSDPAARPAAPDPGDESWDPRLLEALHDLVHREEIDHQALAGELAGLAALYGGLVYSELLHLLSHLRFPPEEARSHWESIRVHREHMQARLGSTVDLRVALVSYFVDVARKLKNPKIIEMHLFERTRDSAYRDELTGLHNYRLFREYLHKEIQRSERGGEPLSLVMIDVDDFKAYNDRCGHEAGNQVLAAIAQAIQRVLRRVDLAARYGGEEFALILPATPKTTARSVAEGVRQAVEHDAQCGRLTLSLGIATYPADASEGGELVRRADRAMYAAKAAGKNQVQLYGKSQRSFDRFDASFSVRARVAAGETLPMVTRNVSEGGILLTSERELPVGAVLDLELNLPACRRVVRAAGRVVHLEPVVAGRFHVALRIIDMEDEDRALLVEYARGRRGEFDPTGTAK